MAKESSKAGILLKFVLATFVFSIFIKVDSIFQLANRLADQEWTLIQILFAITGIRLVLAGLAVLFLIPWILNEKESRTRLSDFLRVDGKIILIGLLSFLLFCGLGWVLSLALGLDLGDWSSLTAAPDLNPDPDLIGWGYFLLALVPGIWEELAFRGWIQNKLLKRYSARRAVLLSAVFFALFHFSNLINQSPSQAISGVVMAFFFGLGWGWLTLRSGSVLPAMISHYLVDCLGLIFLNADGSDPMLQTLYILALTLIYPVFTILLAKIFYPGKDSGI